MASNPRLAETEHWASQRHAKYKGERSRNPGPWRVWGFFASNQQETQEPYEVTTYSLTVSAPKLITVQYRLSRRQGQLSLSLTKSSKLQYTYRVEHLHTLPPAKFQAQHLLFFLCTRFFAEPASAEHGFADHIPGVSLRALIESRLF